MMVASFLVSMSYLGTIIWTSRGLTGAVSEILTGILLLGAGSFGAIAGGLLGSMIRKQGYRLPIILGFLTLFSGMSILILVGDITLPNSIPIVGLALALVGWAGGLLLPVLITYSQVIAPDSRGVLAGVVTFSAFLGSALIPTVYEPLFHIGMTYLYMGIAGVSVMLLVVMTILYRRIGASRDV
jgi:hypothetical protein